MTDLASAETTGEPSPLAVARHTSDNTEVVVRTLGDHRVIMVTIGGQNDPRPLAAADGKNLALAATMAVEQRLPLVYRLSSTGAAVHEGLAATNAWGIAARSIARASGVVPTIVVVHGAAVAGPALLIGLADFAVLTEAAYAYVSGPQAVQQYTGVPITPEALGGAALHARTDGSASFVVADLDEADDLVSDLLTFLPAHVDALPPVIPTADPTDRRTDTLTTILPDSSTGAYDVRDVLRAVADDGEILECRTDWASNIVTAFGTVGGRPVGFVANQPQSLAGTLNIEASQKGARFVGFCDAFNIPLVTFIDTPGFYPGKDLEWRGMIRHGAQLAFAYARATVPRVAVTLRKAYGGAYIVMDSKYMGNDVMLAWPSAEIAVMGAKGAAEILHRNATPEERVVHEAEYEERLLNPYVAAERGSVDAVIDPAETRIHIASALDMLSTKREKLRSRRHDNIPL